MRRLGVLLATLLVAPAAAGCLAGDQPRSQNLRTPRLVVDVTADNETTMYLHAAFTSEEVYEALLLSVDNTTVSAGTYTYAVTHKTNQSTFRLDADVRDGDERWRYRARLGINTSSDRLSVAEWDRDEERLGPATNATLPFKKVVPTYDAPMVEE